MRPTLRRVTRLASLSPTTIRFSNLSDASSHRPVSFWICEQCHRSRTTTEHYYGSPIEPRTRRWSSGRRANTNSQMRAYTANKEDGRNGARDNLPSHLEGRRSPLSKRFAYFMDHMQSNIFIAGQRLNDLTGYSGIELLKKDIEDQGRANFQTLN